MQPREEMRLTTLLWEAATEADGPLNQRQIDAILQVQPHATLEQVPPRQRPAPDTGSSSRVWTDTGDQRWLDDLVERHRLEQLTVSPVSRLPALACSVLEPQIGVSPVCDSGGARRRIRSGTSGVWSLTTEHE